MNPLSDLIESVLEFLLGSLDPYAVAWCGIAVGAASLVSLFVTPRWARTVKWWQLTPGAASGATKVDKVASVAAVGALGGRRVPWGACITIVRLEPPQPASGASAASGAHAASGSGAACEVYLAISGIRDPQEAFGCARAVATSAGCVLKASTAPDLAPVPGRWRLSKVVAGMRTGTQSSAASPPNPTSTDLVAWSTNAEGFLQGGGAMVITTAPASGSGAKVRATTTSKRLAGSWMPEAEGTYRATNGAAGCTLALLGPVAGLALGAVIVCGEWSLLGSWMRGWVSADAYVPGWVSTVVAAAGIGVQLYRPRLRRVVRRHARLPLGLTTRYRRAAVHRSHLAGWAKPN